MGGVLRCRWKKIILFSWEGVENQKKKIEKLKNNKPPEERLKKMFIKKKPVVMVHRS